MTRQALTRLALFVAALAVIAGAAFAIGRLADPADHGLATRDAVPHGGSIEPAAFTILVP